MSKYIILVGLCLTMVFQSFAQQDLAAKAILAKMSKKYKSYKTISAQFSLLMQNGTQSQSQNGNIWLKGSKYRLTFPEQELFSDGKSTWSYSKENKEIEWNTANLKNDGSFAPTTIFSFYEQGYKYLLEPDQKKGSILCQLVELAPIASSNYFKIRLWIQKSNTSLYAVEVFSKDGSRLTYTLSRIQANKAISDTKFTFNNTQYPGVEVVDLR